MIRVTPVGGEPLELPEHTPCIDCKGWGGAVTVEQHWHWGDAGLVTGANNLQQRCTIRNLHSLLADGCDAAFVRIGEAWPLCDIETWRERAQRLERELAAALAEQSARTYQRITIEDGEWTVCGFRLDASGRPDQWEIVVLRQSSGQVAERWRQAKDGKPERFGSCPTEAMLLKALADVRAIAEREGKAGT